MADHEAIEPLTDLSFSSNSLSGENNTSSIEFPKTSVVQAAWQDFLLSLKSWPVWLTLAYQDIQLRYRRSVIGPFWITLSMAITVYSMGYLYSHLFHTDLSQYFPYLVSGMLAWSLISSLVTELVDTYASSESMLKQIKLPYCLYIHKVITRNVIIFFHNILVIVPVLIIFHDSVPINFNILFLFPGLFVVYVNAFLYGVVLAMLGARFRDISQIVRSLIQVVFFVTPIMWNPSVLPPEQQYIAKYNPFYSLVEFIRAPLTGHHPTLFNCEMMALVTIIGFVAFYMLFPARRARIIYWV